MKNKLKQFANNIWSQFGEDGIIQKVFEILPKQEVNWCVEFGAWDGKHLSNTHELISNYSWKGVLIEGNKKKIPDLEKTYKNSNNVTLINKLINFEGVDTLDNILKPSNIPFDFELLSIDIDGNDYHIWESIKNYSPKVVIIEFNPSIPSDVEFVQEKEFSVNHGSSLLSLIKLGKLKGYEIIATTLCNGFFVRKEYYNLFEMPDNSITNIWDSESQHPRIFQLYDGTLVLTEEFKLIWSNDYVKKYDLQKLPRFLRHFSDSPNWKGFYNKFFRKIYNKLQAIKNKRH